MLLGTSCVTVGDKTVEWEAAGGERMIPMLGTRMYTRMRTYRYPTTPFTEGPTQPVVMGTSGTQVSVFKTTPH